MLYGTILPCQFSVPSHFFHKFYKYFKNVTMQSFFLYRFKSCILITYNEMKWLKYMLLMAIYNCIFMSGQNSVPSLFRPVASSFVLN